MNDKEQAEQALRKKAEEIFRTTAEEALATPDEMSAEEVRRLLHELRVHQIELEMQNDELRRTQDELEVQRARYFDLYDLAPVGYVTVSEQGMILEANLTAATLLGVTRGVRTLQPTFSMWIFKEDQGVYYLHRKKLFETGEPQACELRMVRKDGTSFWVHLEATTAQGEDGAPVCRVIMSDITEMMKIQEALQKALQDVHTLHGMLPICAWCKRIRDDEGYWNQMETYIHEHTEATFSHGICPECFVRLQQEFKRGNPGDEDGVPFITPPPKKTPPGRKPSARPASDGRSGGSRERSCSGGRPGDPIARGNEAHAP